MQPKQLSLNQLIIETESLLTRLIGEDITLVTALSPEETIVEVDPGQMTQVIMNLALNARDAMPLGGKLSIITENVYLDESMIEELAFLRPGPYVKLSVSDTGTGIEEVLLEHIFEPFYTTKKVGEGTGLGLATVYGIIKQLNGYIWVDSKLGEGSTFNIYLQQFQSLDNKEKLVPSAEKLKQSAAQN